MMSARSNSRLAAGKRDGFCGIPTPRALSACAVVLVLLLCAHEHAAAQDVDSFMKGVARVWGQEDAEAISDLADRAGIALEVEGTHVGVVTPRHAAAVLRRVFGDRETLRAVAGTARMMPGSRTRAYAEIVWERRARGTTQTERVNVFVAAARVGDSWRITEIRLMP